MTKNVNMTIEDGVLTILVDLSEEHGMSASGKRKIIASTGVNVQVPGGDGAVIGLNVYRKTSS